MADQQHQPTDPTGPEFDPDSGLEQPDGLLQAMIQRIEGEIRALQFPSFNQADALNLGLMLVNFGTSRSLPIAIDIRREGHVLFHASLPGATPDNELWVAKKSRTAARYCEPSLLVGLRGRVGGGRVEDNQWFDQSRYAAHGGAFPLFVKGTGAVATVTVSGLPQVADHKLVVEALAAYLEQTAGTGAG
ncbi:heme-degrading domain-containing protein [Pseudarthrobacter sp. J64]|uniref:heme-degrading domain-containing protein n=1 Tax=Pseudarthrobacter sp. J64 TaxID=3116485 RepID=UPI002E80960F|nr:heme-degrading domain-containing protein [Pseudarthrobacter sp. J64]MEE2568425.1 heme-degrading domain-containing protein [Pseudarthrobacter sp. J64]